MRKQQMSLRQNRRTQHRRSQLEFLEDRLLLAVRVWDGGGLDNLWSNPVNWVGDVAPMHNDELVFTDAGAQKTNVNDLAPETIFTTISFDGSGYDISGSSVILTGGLASSATTGDNSFTAPIKLIGSQTLGSANAGSTLTLGNVDTGSLFVLTANGDGTLDIAGAVSGSGSITKLGSGTLVLSGNNTYGGVTSVTEGVVRAQHANALGAASAPTIVGVGAALEIGGGINVAGEAVQLTGRGINGVADQFGSTGALRSVSGNNFWGGTVTLSGTVVVGANTGSSLNIGGVVSGLSSAAANLVKMGGGTLEFSGTGSNTYSGTTFVNEGTLRLSKTGGAEAITGNLTIGDHIGTDVVELGASNQIAHLDGTGTVNRTLLVNSSGLLNLNGFDDVVGAVTFERSPNLAGSITTGVGTLTLEGTLTVQNTLVNSTSATPAATISGNLNLGSRSRTFNVLDSEPVAGAQTSPDLVITADISGAAGVHLLKIGTGYLSLSGDNHFAGNFYATGGLGIGSDTALGDGLFSMNGIVVAEGGARTVSNDFSIDGTITVAGSNNLTFAGPANLTANRIINVVEAGQVTEFSGGIGEQMGTRSLTVNGLGTVQLTGRNTFSNSLVVGSSSVLNPLASSENYSDPISGGNVVISGLGSIQSVQAITVNADAKLTLDNSTINMNDRIGDAGITLASGAFEFIGIDGGASAESFGAIVSNTGHGRVIVTPGAGGTAEINPSSLTAVTAGGTLEFSTSVGELGDAAKVRFATSPALTNFMINRTFISDASGESLATIDAVRGITDFQDYAVDPADLTSLPITASVRLTSGNYVLTGNAIINALVLDGSNISIDTNGFEFRVSSGVILDTGSNNSITGAGMLSTGGANSVNVTTVQAASTTTISATIPSTTTGGVTKAGLGTLNISGINNLYTGAVSVNEGTLRISDDSGLGAATGGVAIRDGATLELNGVNIVGEGITSFVGLGVGGEGAVRAVGGATSSWTGNAVMGTGAVGSLGASTGSTLIMTGVISGSTAALIKVGEGTVELGGTAANSYTGATYVNSGLLRLNKTDGVNAVGSNLVIGDHLGGSGSDRVELLNHNQIPTVIVTVNSSGLLDLNGFTDLIGASNIRIGVGQAGQITTGAGTLILGGTMQVDVLPGGDTTATITGNLSISNSGTAAVTRTITIGDSAATVDLDIIGTVTSTGSATPVVNLTKNGAGTLQFSGSGDNNYTGSTTVSQGTLQLNKSGIAVPNALTIGDNIVTEAVDRVVFLADGQVPSTTAVSVVSSGLLDFGSVSNVINTLTVTSGTVVGAGGGSLTTSGLVTLTGGTIDTGAGTLVLGGNVTAPSGVLKSVIAGNLDLGGTNRTFTTSATAAGVAIDLDVSANISNGSLTYAGNSQGALLLSGNNTFSGFTYSVVGTLMVGSNTALGAGNYTQNIAGNILAFGGARTIANPIALANSTIVQGFNDLTYSDASGIPLTANGAMNVVNAGTTVTIAGPISQDATNRTLAKSGRGTLVLQGNNTYVGATTIAASGGVLILEGTNATTGTFGVGEFGTAILRGGGELDTIGALTVAYGGTMQVDNSTIDNTDRLPTVTTTITNGRFEFLANDGVGGSSEAMGTLTISGEQDSSVHLVNNGLGTSALTFNALTLGARSTLAIRGTGEDIGAGNQLIFNTLPAQTGGIISRARIIDGSGLNFATQAAAATTVTAAAFNNDINAGGNVKLTGAGGEVTQLTGDVNINALLLANDVNISQDVAGRILAIATGYIGVEGGDSEIEIGALRFGTLATPNVTGVIVTNSSLTLDTIVHSTATESLTKTGLGTLILDQANTYTGTTRIGQGGAIIHNNEALGSTGSGTPQTIVSNRAFLLVDGSLTIGNEHLNVTGSGFYNDQTGVVRGTNGNSTWGDGTTIFTRGGTNYLGVDTGSVLNLNGIIAGTTTVLNIVGGGILETSGSSSNTYTGATNILDGTYRLSKTGGATAIIGVVTVGDGVGGNDADRLVHNGTGQISVSTTNRPFTVQSSGRWELNGDSLALTSTASGANVLTVNSGPYFSGDVDLGGGTLTLRRTNANGGLVGTAVTFGAASTDSPAPTISNGVITYATDSLNFALNIADNAATVDIDISAKLAGAIQKSGAGGVKLSTNNDLLTALQLSGGTVIIPQDDAFGTAPLTLTATTTIQGDDDSTLRTIANDISMTGGTLTLGGFQGIAPLAFTGAISSATSTVARAITAQNKSTNFSGNFDLGGTSPLTITAAGSTSTPAGNITTVSGNITNLTNLVKAGGGILVLEGANTQTGTTSVTSGILRVRNSAALGTDGSAASRTIVSANAALELDGVSIGDEYLDLSATTAFFNSTTAGFPGGYPTGTDVVIPGTQAIRGVGTLRNVSGNNTWGTGATEVRLLTNPSDIFVADSTSLTLNATVLGGAAATITSGLVKSGEGTLVLGGTVSNNFTGAASILEGTLELGKAAGLNSLNTATINLGDGIGTDILRWTANDQVLNPTIAANQSGVMQLNGFTESLTAVTLGIGATSAGAVTGGGQLNTNGSLLVPVDSRATVASPAASITADYGLGGTAREFRVGDSPADEELVINGSISATANIGINKTGYGLMRYTGGTANTYNGTTAVNGGTLVLDKAADVIAIPAALTVGNGIGDQDQDVLISLHNNQIAGTGTTTVNASGFLQLVDADNIIGLLTINAGLTGGGHIATGTGTLTVTGNITGGVVVGIVETSSLIEGNLNLGGARTIAVSARQNTLDASDELQVIDLAGATGGSFNLTFEGHTTTNLNFNATLTDIQNALRALNTIGTQNVTVVAGPVPNIFYVYFRDGLGKTDVPEIVMNSSLTGAVGTPGVSTRQDGYETVELTIDALMSNSTAVTKSGTGALLLTNSDNSFDSLTFSGGFLFLGGDDVLGAGTVTIGTASVANAFRAIGADRTITNDIILVAAATTLQFTGTNEITIDTVSALTLTNTTQTLFFVAEPGGVATVESVVAGNAANRVLTKTGSGTLNLNNANTYTGATNVNAGTLAGTGSVAGALNVDGVTTALPFSNPSNLTPGFGEPGIFSAGNTTFNAQGSLSGLIGGATAGNGAGFYNQLDVTGTVTIVAGAMFDVAAFNGYVPQAGDIYVFIDNDGVDAITGQFANVAEGQVFSNFLGSGLDAFATYLGGDGANDFVIMVTGDSSYTGTAAGENFELRRHTAGPVDLLQLLVGGSVVQSLPFAAVSSFTIDALAGNDTLLVNYAYTGGFFGIPVTFNGGDDSDSMSVNGGSFTNVVFDYDSATGNPDAQSGTIDQDGTVITYTGLEPLVYAGNAVNMTFNLPGTNDQAVLEDDGVLANSRLRLRSTNGQFEQTDFLAPSGSLTINLGADSAVFNVTSLTDLGAATAEINAGAGDDTVTVNASVTHDVTINGEAGLDVITGGSGNDAITGGDDNDSLSGGAGNDTITAGLGDDTLDGGAGNDILLGEAGLDSLFGGDNDDTLDGGTESDLLNGGLGVDNINAGSGDDTIQVQAAEAEFDTMQGGTGYDVVTNIGAGPVTLNNFNPAFDVWTNGIEEYIGNGQTLQGNAGPNGLHLGFQILTNTPIVDGGAGNDSITTSHNNSNASAVLYDGGADIDHVTLVFTPDQLGALTTADILTIKDYLLDPTGKTLSVTSDPAKGNFTATNFESATLAVYDDDVILDITDCILQIISEDQIIVGTMGDDTITGTHLGDLIFGQGGNDVIVGAQGNDCIFGGAGDDTINGSDGDDLLVGGSGNDDISGSLGQDRLLGGSGNDYLRGEQHNDMLYGGSGDDTLDGGVNIDYLDGGDGNDLLIGGLDIDTLLGGEGDDTLDGGAGSDLLNGGPGVDHVFGGDYSDTIQISGDEAEFDVMDAGDGTDILEIIGGGPAILNGLGPASSFGSIRGNGQGIFGNGNANTFDLTGIYPYLLAFVNGLGGNDILIGSAYNDVLIGGLGNDYISGGNGNDTLIGDDGDDTIDGGQGADTIRGGAGADIIDGGTGDDTFQISGNDSIADTLNAGSGTDWIQNVGASDVIFENFDSTISLFERWDNAGFNILGTAGPNMFNFSKLMFSNTPEIHGLAGDDTITGSNGVDRIYGEEGNDMLFGLGGADELYGGDGDDTLDGGAGSDLISGGTGNNQLIGGTSQDTFVVSNDVSTIDAITDYSYDYINLAAFGITYADLVFTQNGANLDISIIGSTKQIRLLNRNTIPNAGYFIF